MELYLIEGEHVEYDDHETWPVRIYDDKEYAERVAKRFTRMDPYFTLFAALKEAESFWRFHGYEGDKLQFQVANHYDVTRARDLIKKIKSCKTKCPDYRNIYTVVAVKARTTKGL